MSVGKKEDFGKSEVGTKDLKRVFTTVRIKIAASGDNPAAEVYKKLLCDSGGHTIVPVENLAPYTKTKQVKLGPLVKDGSIPHYVVEGGATMEVSVENHGGGGAETKSCSKIRASTEFDTPTEQDGVKMDGLLGMDQFDELKADPAKSADSSKGYLAKRV
jgi:hypothetical protein